MINCLHRKVKRHELDNRAQARECRTNRHTGKTMLGDWRINDALGAEFLQQTLRDFISTLIFGHFFADDEYVAIAAHFLGHRIPKRFAHRHLNHFGPSGHFGRSIMGDGSGNRCCSLCNNSGSCNRSGGWSRWR